VQGELAGREGEGICFGFGEISCQIEAPFIARFGVCSESGERNRYLAFPAVFRYLNCVLPFTIPSPILSLAIPDAVFRIQYELEIAGKGWGEENLHSVIFPDIPIPFSQLSFGLSL
jgi:hypothetical protein